MNSQLSHPLHVRPARLLALVGALLLAALIAVPAPALAHDTLLSTDPEGGASLETSPEEVTFTFSDDILDVSPLVRITDEGGEQVAEIVPTIEGPTATATLEEPLPAGTYDIQWRVVSGDGHPIEGTLTLTVEQDPAGSEGATTEEGATAEEGAAASDGGGESAAESSSEQPADSGEQEPQEATDAEPAQSAETEEGGGLSLPLLLGILAVIVVAVVVAGVVIMRRRD